MTTNALRMLLVAVTLTIGVMTALPSHQTGAVYEEEVREDETGTGGEPVIGGTGSISGTATEAKGKPPVKLPETGDLCTDLWNTGAYFRQLSEFFYMDGARTTAREFAATSNDWFGYYEAEGCHK